METTLPIQGFSTVVFKMPLWLTKWSTVDMVISEEKSFAFVYISQRLNAILHINSKATLKKNRSYYYWLGEGYYSHTLISVVSLRNQIESLTVRLAWCQAFQHCIVHSLVHLCVSPLPLSVLHSVLASIPLRPLNYLH